MNLRVCQREWHEIGILKSPASSELTNWFFLCRRLITQMEMRSRGERGKALFVWPAAEIKKLAEEEDPFGVSTHRVPKRTTIRDWNEPKFPKQSNDVKWKSFFVEYFPSHDIASHVKYLTSLSQAIIPTPNWCLFYVNLSSNIGAIPSNIVKQWAGEHKNNFTSREIE